MPSAIAYLARWAALADLGREYKEGSIKARDAHLHREHQSVAEHPAKRVHCLSRWLRSSRS